MTYEHLRTHEEDFEIDRDALEEDGWEIISVSQGMIYWKRTVHSDLLDEFGDDELHTGGPISPVEPDEWIWKEYIPPTILPSTPTYPPYTWPNPTTWEPKQGDIFVTYNFSADTNGIVEKIEAALDRL